MRRSSVTAADTAGLTTPLLADATETDASAQAATGQQATDAVKVQGTPPPAGSAPSALARKPSAFDVESGVAPSTGKPNSLDDFLSALGIKKTDLSTAKIDYVTLQELWKLDQPIRSQLRWANVNHVLEKPFQLLMLLFSTCPPIFYWGRSMLLDNTLRLRFVYAVTAFVRGGLSFVDHVLHGFILFVLFYGLLGNEINLNLDSLKSIYQSQEEIGVVNLVHLLNHLSANMLNLILYSPFIWGAFKILTTNYAVTRPTQQYAQPLLKRFENHKSGMLRNTLPWLLPQSRFASDLRKIDLMLTWDARIYQSAWFVGAKEFLDATIQFAKGKFAYTSIEAMSTLRLVAHGMALTDLLRLKKAGIPTDALTNIIKIKAKAFQAIIEIANTPKNIREKLRDFPRYVYARYVLWDLGAFSRIKLWNIPITIFKAFKLYALVKLYQTIYNTIQAAKQCPEEPGFRFGTGYAEWSAEYTVPCFEMRLGLFRTTNPQESVWGLLQEIPKYHLVGLGQLNLYGKNLLWNETRAMIDAVIQQGATGITELSLSFNNIAALPENAFVGLSGLQSLDLSDTQLASLASGAFSGLRRLQTLGLADNRFMTLPAGLFNGLSELQSLDLSVNQLMSLGAGTFSGLSKLQSLDLSVNQLASLPAGLFNGLSGLQILDLYQNQLVSLAPGIFSGLNALQSLNLGLNPLESLVAGIFSGLLRLQSLDLRGNLLESLAAGTFSGLPELQSLDLSYNLLASLVPGLFVGLNQLLSLDISDNPLSVFPSALFQDLQHLESLGIGGCSFIPAIFNASVVALLPQQLLSLSIEGGISSFSGTAVFSYLTKLQNLVLSFNQLMSLPAGLLSGLNGLQTLDLSVNQLASLPASLFSELSVLQTLALGSNQLVSLATGTFSGLSGLQSLDLDNNQFESIAAGTFSGLSGVQSLDLSQNQLVSLVSGVFNRLSGLQTLYLFSNRIESLASGTFSGLSGVQSLSLGANQLESLAANLFSGLSGLQSLDLSSNQLVSLATGTFNGLSGLQSLYLYGNQLSDITGLTTAGFHALQSLLLAHNQITAPWLKPLGGLLLCMNISSTAADPIDLTGNPINATDANAFIGQAQALMLKKVCENILCQGILNPYQSDSCSSNPAPSDLQLPTLNDTARNLLTSPHTLFQNNAPSDFSKYLFWFVAATAVIATGIFLYQYFFKTDTAKKENQKHREKTNENVPCARKLFSGLSSVTLFSSPPKASPIAEKVAAQNETETPGRFVQVL